MNVNLKKPCGNCPFRKEGAIDLRPGRVAGIVRGLLADDTQNFFCHKTVYAKKTGGRAIELEDGTTTYQTSSRESACAGAMVFLLKAGAPSVAMRMGAALGLIDFRELESQFGDVIEPETLGTESFGSEP